MLSGDDIRGMQGDDAPLRLLRKLGFPVSPVRVSAEAWRAAGVTIGWNGTSRLELVSRMTRLDVFLLRDSGNVDEAMVQEFLQSYQRWNVLIKSILLYHDTNSMSIAIYDSPGRRRLRRLDADLARPSVHAIDRLNLLDVTGAAPAALPRIIDRALDREQVSRRFFERFRDAVQELTSSLRESCRCEPADAISAEALLLASRLLFLSFVQEKGWLDGRRRFLVDGFQKSVSDGREYFTTVLQPLFFGCLNTPAARRTAGARALGTIPYLNGGLFEPSPFELRNPELRVPNDLVGRLLEDVFERFDFRIDERDSAGTHVDPEMLGKVFESLMAADERAASGSFYTPREIVDAVTARAIEEWLTEGHRQRLEQHCPEEARRLIGRLERVTVIDPACGSGAFLLSALGVIERLFLRLSAVAGAPIPDNLRQQIVERSLFGVDRKPEAVRLCELRLWLAIVAGTGCEAGDVPPLPNLDRNILQGNTLLGPADFLGDGRADLYRDWLMVLRAQRDVIARYRTATHEERPALARLIRSNDLRLASELLRRSVERDEETIGAMALPSRDLFGNAVTPDPGRLQQLHDRLAESRRALARVEEGTLDFFSFDVHFAHVMGDGGFDIVAGNPPWVRNANIEPAARRLYADRYALFRGAGERGFHQPDLAVAFFERALSLSSRDGVVAMLLPSKVATASYGAALRRRLQDELQIIDITDWTADARRWFDADTFPLSVTVARRSQARPTRVAIDGENFELEQSTLSVSGPSSPWALIPPDTGAILQRLRREHAPLAEVLGREPVMGVKTGDNGRFFLDITDFEGDQLITADGLRVPLSAVCRCVRGRDVKRWKATDSQWMIWPPAGGWRKPPAWLQTLAAARGTDPASFRLSYVRPEHVGIKVAWKDLSRGMAAAVLPDVVHIRGTAVPLVPNQTLYSIDTASLEEAHLLSALLNSIVAGALLVSVAEQAKDAHYRYFARTVGAMPVPPIDVRSAIAARLIRAARRAMHDGDPSEGERLVAAVYGVSDDELAILRRFLDRRTDRDPAR